MKIITIGTDYKIFENARLYERQREYSFLVDQYYIFVFVNINLKNKVSIIQDNNFKIIPIFYKYKIFSFFSLYRSIKKEAISASETILSSQDAFFIGLITYFLSKLFQSIDFMKRQ